MKYCEESNYYELLEVSSDASVFEIRSAYKKFLAIYEEESFATYTLFTIEERDQILERLEEAFNTLLDEKKRVEYDKILVDSGVIKPSQVSNGREKKPIPIFQAVKSNDKGHFLKKINAGLEKEGTKSLIENINLQTTISGKDLKRLRETIGIELHEIFEVSRISISILKAIEEENIKELPSTIYLKGFLKTYAQLFNLDLDKLVNNFIKNIAG